MRENNRQGYIKAVNDFIFAVKNADKNAFKLFSALDDEQKLRCVRPKKNTLFRAVGMGFNLDLIEPLISITDPSLIFKNKFNVFKQALAPTCKVKPEIQLKVLKFILQYIEQKKLKFDVLEHIEYALDFGVDKHVLIFLKAYKKYLTKEISTHLLNNVCEKKQLMPECMALLIQSGGILSPDHTQIFSGVFMYKKYIPEETEIKKIVDHFREQKIEIPMHVAFFTKYHVHEGKEILVKYLIKNCSPEYWEHTEKTFAELADNIREINFQLIKDCYKLHPEKKISQPKDLVKLGFCAIKERHSLIHTLLERGLNLNQIVTMQDRTDITNVRISLGQYAAFYSTDTKLQEKLRTIDSTNIFGRNPAHYAALAMPCEYEEKDKRKRKTISSTLTVDPRLEGKGSRNVIIPFPETFVSLNLFNFKMIGSSQAFANAILSPGALASDFFDFTPLDYAATNLDPTKRREMLSAFETLLLASLGNILINLPTALIPIIVNYISYDPRDSENPNQMLISWARALILKTNDFTSELKKILIDPLKKYFDEGNNFIKIIKDKAKIITAIRNAMYLFTIGSLMDGAIPYRLYPSTMIEELTEDRPVHRKLSHRQNKRVKKAHPIESILHPLPAIGQAFELPASPPLQTGLLSGSSSRHSSLPGAHLFARPQARPPAARGFGLTTKKNKKRSRSEEFFQQQPTVSWKENRDSMVEQLSQCYQSGSRTKLALKNVLDPYIKQLSKATHGGQVTQYVKLINDTLNIPGTPLQVTIESYGLSEFMKHTLGQESQTQTPSSGCG